MRDRKRLPALDALLARTLDEQLADLAVALTDAFAPDRKARKRPRAVIALALDFSTWQRLTDEGLTDSSAADAMADAVARTAGR